MTKSHVAEKVVQKTGMSKRQSLQAIDIFLESIKSALKRGEKISLVGFGTFYIKEKRARGGRNPRTGEKINIPTKKVPIFKPGKSFREMINR